MARYLVTGATGFLGTHLVRQLVREGHTVVALVRATQVDLDDVTQMQGDVLDKASIVSAAQNCDGIFHCAGKVSRKAEDAESMWQVHVLGTRNVVQAARAAKVKRVVIASTSGTIALSTDAVPLSENAPAPRHLVSRWPYYRTKLFAEDEALKANGADLEVVSVNPSLLLGPGDVRGSSTDDVRLFLEKKVQAVPRGGVAFVDARDAATALVLAMQKGRPGERYLVSASNVSVREFSQKLSRLSGIAAPVLPLPKSPELAKQLTSLFEKVAKKLGGEVAVSADDVDIAQHYWYCDVSRATKELGWAPRDPTETLQDTIDDLYARGVVWPDGTHVVKSTVRASGGIPQDSAAPRFVDHGR